jgi:phosphatidate cytidylyltransferase
VTPVNQSASTGTADELRKRIASGLVLAVLAVITAISGGSPFALLWAAAAIGVFWEWSAIVADGAMPLRLAGCTALAVAAAAVLAGAVAVALPSLAAGAVFAAVLAPQGRRLWGTGGALYAGILLLAPVVLRGDPQLGRTAILFLFAVVWATDICGFFVGRWLGGPKLAPRISPGKTWSGAAGGMLGAIAAALVVMRLADTGTAVATACLAAVLSIVAQGGDLLESAVKRRFRVKDAGHIIPGHGGLMDRLDGFLAAAGVAALIGFARGGIDASARGLLWW